MSDSGLDEVLFGADGTERVVAVETGEREATLFVRTADGGTETRTAAVRRPGC